KSGDKISIGDTILKFEYKDLADQSFFEQIYRLATTDGLTSLLNKVTITRILSEEIAKWERYHRRLSLILLDIDNFKPLNDRYGHLTGDRVLRSVGGVIRRNLRQQDKAGRFGGEEFLIVTPETGARGAAQLAKRIRVEIQTRVAHECGLKEPV